MPMPSIARSMAVPEFARDGPSTTRVDRVDRDADVDLRESLKQSA
jgi:hypothetical protein